MVRAYCTQSQKSLCVNRSPGLASSYRSAFPSQKGTVASCSFVSFTVTGIARNFHPPSLGAAAAAPALWAHKHTSFGCENIIARLMQKVNCKVRIKQQSGCVVQTGSVRRETRGQSGSGPAVMGQGPRAAVMKKAPAAFYGCRRGIFPRRTNFYLDKKRFCRGRTAAPYPTGFPCCDVISLQRPFARSVENSFCCFHSSHHNYIIPQTVPHVKFAAHFFRKFIEIAQTKIAASK